MNCFRCGTEIENPNHCNADYVIADDTIVDDEVTVFEALQHNKKTKDKIKALEPVLESDYTATEVPSVEAAKDLKDVAFVHTAKKIRPIQKTGLICPDCHRETDVIIWGIHKMKGGE